MSYRPHPHVTIPPGAGPPANPSSEQPLSPINLWADRRHSSYTSYTPVTPNTASTSYLGSRISLDVPGGPPSRPSSAYELETSRISFPEPQLYRSSSQRSTYRSPNNLIHRSTKSDSILSPDSILTPTQFSLSGESRPPSFDNTPESFIKDLSSELSDLSLDSEEGLRKFQNDLLPVNDEEWHRLVPPEAQQVLDDHEVKRQCILFEIIKTEKDYVSDLELIKEVFIDPLKNTLAVPSARVRGFIAEVFFNLDDILAHNQRMLAALFARQRDQFPLVQSVTDIILDNSLLFRADYEDYIKHYPIAEMRHRSEIRRNPRYQYLIQQCSLDPRVRKRDIITFISRPVTRLPRLRLLLENALKHTAPDHPDYEAIPLVLGILNEFIKSTQPGIEAAEEKARFWSLCETLVYQKGEIMDLDLYDDSRSLRYQGPLVRKFPTEMGVGWSDLQIALLDNYLLQLKASTSSNKTTRHLVVSRPIPMDYLRLGVFDLAAENRKEKAEDGSLGLLDRVRPRYRQVFPFTFYHAAAKNSRRYVLYASTDAERQKWREVLEDALQLRRYRQDGNMYFVPHSVNDGFFKRPVNNGTNAFGSHFTGQVNAVTKFYSGSHKFISVACSSGVYVALKGEPAFRKVLNVPNPTCLVALPAVNKFFVLHEDGLYSYSLDLIARAALGMSSTQSVDASRERIATDVTFFRAGRVGHRIVVLYTAKSIFQLYLYALEVISNGEANANPRRSMGGLYGFRSFGEALSIHRDTHNISVINKHIAISSSKGLAVVDPSNLNLSGSGRTASFPDFAGVDPHCDTPASLLLDKCSRAVPLGIIQANEKELLVVYNEVGCYTDRHGTPLRSCGYLRWDIKAVSYSHRGDYLILFSSDFIEIRAVESGKLVQVIEGIDIRRLDVGLLNADKDSATIFARKGREEQGLGVDAIEELVETTELKPQTTDADRQALWEDWDAM